MSRKRAQPQEPIEPELSETATSQSTDEPSQSDADHPGAEDTTDPAPHANESAPSATGGRRRAGILRPIEALERFDRQWEDRTPLAARSEVTSLVMTVPEDPSGFDYLGAMGLSIPELAEALLAWLEAQLAADALELGRVVRPAVALVPAGRLWFVARMVLHSIVVIDGPGYLTPGSAVRAARIRYRALLEAERARATEVGWDEDAARASGVSSAKESAEPADEPVTAAP